MSKPTVPWKQYLIFGTAWNAVVLAIMGASSSGAFAWYAGLGYGLLMGGAMTLLGETVLRSADIGLRREHGVLAYLSPSWWFRVVFSLVPGLVARSTSERPATAKAFEQFLDQSRDFDVILRRTRSTSLAAGDAVVLIGRPYTVVGTRPSPEDDRTYVVTPA